MVSSVVTTTVPFMIEKKHMGINDLLQRYIDYLIKKNNSQDRIEFGLLEEKEITPRIRRLVSESNKKPLSSFKNLQ